MTRQPHAHRERVEVMAPAWHSALLVPILLAVLFAVVVLAPR